MSVRWALTGCGQFAEETIVPAIVAQPDSELLAVHSRSKERAAEVAAAHAVPKHSDDYGDMLSDDEIDAVYVATETCRHEEQAIEAARAGKHVLVERPMAASVAACQRMIQAAGSAGVFLAVAHSRRFHPKIAKLKQLVDEGAAGEIVSGRVLHTTLFRPAPDSHQYWRVVASQSGGGCTQELGSDRIDVLCYLLGAPSEVSAFCATSQGQFEVEDTMAMLIRFASGVHVSCHFQWNVPVGRDNFELFGTEGAIIATPTFGHDIILCMPSGDTRHELGEPKNPHAPLIEDFALHVSAGRPPSYPAEEALATVQVIAAAYEAAQARETIRIEPLPG